MNISIAPDIDSMTIDAARYIIEAAGEAITERGLATIVLSGGNTPKPLFKMLGSSEYSNKLDWSKVYLFWGDDRCVPYDHKHSNVKAVFESMIEPLSFSEEQVIAMPSSITPLDAAAVLYQESIRLFFAAYRQPLSADGFPVFDICLMGMGDDGHTASLFPGNDNDLTEVKKWIIPVHAPNGKPPGYRLTMTLPLFNSARNVLFMVRGTDKSDIIGEIMNNPDSAFKKYPAAQIIPEGNLTWIIDQDAATGLV